MINMNLFVSYIEDEFKSFILMCKNEQVLYVDRNNNRVFIMKPNLLPFGLRRVDKNLSVSDVILWLNNRAFNMGRTNAKKIAIALNLSQINLEDSWQYSNALSLTDCYWIQYEKEYKNWNEINLYENDLDKVVSEIALKGSALKIKNKVGTPEVTTDGVCPKSWIRKNNKTYLYKGSKDLIIPETHIEVLASDILDKLNIKHVNYWLEDDFSVYENMTNTKLSKCSMNEYMAYCREVGLEPYHYLYDYVKDYSNMAVVDYIINNWDRHDGNWGIYYDADTGKQLMLHPLFDHNNSLLVINEDGLGNEKSYLNSNFTRKELAKQLKSYCTINTDNLVSWLKEISTIKRFQDLFEKMNLIIMM